MAALAVWDSAHSCLYLAIRNTLTNCVFYCLGFLTDYDKQNPPDHQWWTCKWIQNKHFKRFCKFCYCSIIYPIVPQPKFFVLFCFGFSEAQNRHPWLILTIQTQEIPSLHTQVSYSQSEQCLVLRCVQICYSGRQAVDWSNSSEVWKQWEELELRPDLPHQNCHWAMLVAMLVIASTARPATASHY